MKEKKVLIYLLRRLTELTNQEIGEVVGMSIDEERQKNEKRDRKYSF